MKRKVLCILILLLLCSAAGSLYFSVRKKRGKQISNDIQDVLVQKTLKKKLSGKTIKFRLSEKESVYAGPYAGNFFDFCKNRKLQRKVKDILDQNQHVTTECSKIYQLHLKYHQICKTPLFLREILLFYCDQMAWACFQENKTEAVRIVRESLYFSRTFTNSDTFAQHSLFAQLSYTWLEMIWVPFRRQFVLTEVERDDFRNLLEDVRAECVARTCLFIQSILRDSTDLSVEEKVKILESIQTKSKPVFKYEPPPQTVSEKIRRRKIFATFFIERLNGEIKILLQSLNIYE